MTEETPQTPPETPAPPSSPPAEISIGVFRQEMEARFAELETVLHDVVAQTVGHGSTAHHGRLYRWYASVKARVSGKKTPAPAPATKPAA